MINIKYQCSMCSTVHDWEEDAVECCKPDVITVYECPECEAIHSTELEAEQCCGE